MDRRGFYTISARRLLAVAVGLIGLVLATRYPLGTAWGVSGFLATAALLIARRKLWFLALPFVLVAGDLYPWTGSLLISEADLFCSCGLAILLWRSRDDLDEFVEHKWIFALWVPIAVSTVVSLLRGWSSLPPSLPGDQLSLYTSQWNSVRVAKGLAWGMVFAPFIFARINERDSGFRDFVRSIQASALFVGLGVVAERLISVGLFNFQEVYRATGPLYSMHVGGQHIDAFWVMVLPLVFLPLALGTSLLKWLGGFSVLSLALYAIVATMSRGLIALTGVGLLVGAILSILFAWHQSRPRTAAALSILAVLTVASALLFAAIEPMRERFSTTGADWSTRWHHWSRLCTAAGDGGISATIGNGLGTVPSLIARMGDKPARPAELVSDGDGQVALRLRPGESFFIEQLVDVDAPSPWKISGSIRGDGAMGVTALVCEKTLIQSLDCLEALLPAAAGSNQWQSFERIIDLTPLESAPHFLPRLPVTFALSAGGESGSVDVAHLKLEDARGTPVLKNSDFRAGSAHWFFTSDDHLAWHAKNLWVHLFVEQGWLGVASFAWLSVGTLGLAVYRAVHYPDMTSWVLVMSLVGTLSMGLFDALVDAPWIAQLLCLLLAVSQSVAYENAPRHEDKSRGAPIL